MATSEADERLCGGFVALSNPVRLEILRMLRRPLILRDIHTDERVISRQAIRKHLDTLLDAGLIQTREAAGEFRDTTEFFLNHQRLFDVAEDVRTLARLRPAAEPDVETIRSRVEQEPARQRTGPGLLLVKGADEGAFFPLDEAGKAEWIVGRRRGVDVPLDYDGSVSSENARISWAKDRHWIEDVRGSRNGTMLNLRRLTDGQRVALERGDVIGVGRSTLVYWR